MAPLHRGQAGNKEEDVGRSSFEVDPDYTRSPESSCFLSIVLRVKVLSRTMIQSVVCLRKTILVVLKFSWER